MRPGDAATLGNDKIIADIDTTHYARPEFSFVIVHDRNARDATLQQVQQTFGLENFVSGDDHRWSQTASREIVTHLTKVFGVTAGRAHKDLFTGEVVERADIRCGWSENDDLAYIGQQGACKCDQFPAFGRHGKVGGDEVANAINKSRYQLVTADGYWDDINTHMTSIQLFVDICLEAREHFISGATGTPGVIEELVAAIRCQDAQHAPLDHAVEVAPPGPPYRLELRRQHILRGGVRRRIGFCDRLGIRCEVSSCLRPWCRDGFRVGRFATCH
jgi:hypothetical protein